MMELVKLPVPEPSSVLEFPMLGLGLALQHTPREVTVVPPSLVILPPLEAEFGVIKLTTVVEMVAATAEVEKAIELP